MANQLIDQDGHFNERGIEAIKKSFKLEHWGLSYAVVSIMGSQSSGKSTLLNRLFNTNFTELDAKKRRVQITKGIWLAKAVNIDRCTIVLDLEGSDGIERGEDNTVFEKQSALFALAVSNIVLINLWYHDIGRVQASNMPLLKTVFQVYMTRLFSPRKTTLLFVIRDTFETPLEELDQILRQGIQKIWDSIPKPEAHKETPIDGIFNVEVVALPRYKVKEDQEQFKEQVASLRQRLARNRRALVPATEFFFSAQQIWKDIKESKDLNLPAHNVMVATTRCQEIAKEKLAGFCSNEEWRQLEVSVQNGLVPQFGWNLSTLLDKLLFEYDMEAQYLDDGVKTEKRMQLKSDLLQLAHPACESMLSHLSSKTLDDFKEAFDKALRGEKEFDIAVHDCTQSFKSKFEAGCEEAFVGQVKWDCLEVRKKITLEKIMQDFDAYVASVRANKELQAKYEDANRRRQSRCVCAVIKNIVTTYLPPSMSLTAAVIELITKIID